MIFLVMLCHWPQHHVMPMASMAPLHLTGQHIQMIRNTGTVFGINDADGIKIAQFHSLGQEN